MVSRKAGNVEGRAICNISLIERSSQAFKMSTKSFYSYLKRKIWLDYNENNDKAETSTSSLYGLDLSPLKFMSCKGGILVLCKSLKHADRSWSSMYIPLQYSAHQIFTFSGQIWLIFWWLYEMLENTELKNIRVICIDSNSGIFRGLRAKTRELKKVVDHKASAYHNIILQSAQWRKMPTFTATICQEMEGPQKTLEELEKALQVQRNEITVK